MEKSKEWDKLKVRIGSRFSGLLYYSIHKAFTFLPSLQKIRGLDLRTTDRGHKAQPRAPRTLVGDWQETKEFSK